MEQNTLSFLDESVSLDPETETVGSFKSATRSSDLFDEIYTETYNDLKANGVDMMLDINNFIKNNAVMDSIKDKLLQTLEEETEPMQDDPDSYGSHAGMYNQISEMFDNCKNDLITEAVKVGNLLPIKAVDFPILIKQQLKLATKDIMQTEVTKQPIIKKHIEQTYVVDHKSGNRWKYPQCFFNDEYKEIYKAGKGLPIKPTKVALPANNFDVISQCTDGDVKIDEFTIDLKIDKVYLSTDKDAKFADINEGDLIEYVLQQPMRINLADDAILGGKIDTDVTDKTGNKVHISDQVAGFVDYTSKTVSINSIAGYVKAVSFTGYLSNERNERTVQFEYKREEREWHIEDGFRVDAPFSLEQLTDHKALLNIDLYQKTYNYLVDILVQMEDSQVLDFLDEQFKLYDGIELDPLDWNPFITKSIFDVDSTSLTTALPNEFIAQMLKFHIDRLITDICDTAKLEDMTFVIYGNPRFISLLNPIVNWVTRPGSTANGVKLDYSYGVMTSGDVKVSVVSTKKVNAAYDRAEKLYNGLRIIPFPLSTTQFTFKHYKYTTNILTSQNSAYRSAELPGGSMNYVVGTSRYTNAVIQGIQAQVRLANLEPYESLR